MLSSKLAGMIKSGTELLYEVVPNLENKGKALGDLRWAGSTALHGAALRGQPDIVQFLVDKGSIALDGVSLTVVQPEGGRFSVAVIPHTLETTTLGDLKPGERLNVEFDILAKYALNPR